MGRSGAAISNAIDARWTMAYAAGLGDENPRYLDTNDPRGVIAHPLFPVCFEWGVFLTPQAQPGRDGLSAEEGLRGVHATHDLLIHLVAQLSLLLKLLCQQQYQQCFLQCPLLDSTHPQRLASSQLYRARARRR